MVKCDYCENLFCNKSALSNHQKTAKYCIKLQKDLNKDIKEYNCKLCLKIFIRKDTLISHEKICRGTSSKNQDIISLEKDLEQEKNNTFKLQTINAQLNEENINLKIKVAELTAILKGKTELSEKFETLHSKKDNCIEKIALQPKTTTKNTSNSTQNNILNNLPIFNLTKEKLQLIANTEFTHELFLRGQEGAAKFATNIARKENDGDLPWVVSDKNRGIVKMKGEDGIIITDYDVEIITDLIFEAIKDKNQEYFDAAYPPYDTDAEELDPDEAERVEANKARADKCFSDIAKMKRNNKVFKKKLIEYSM